MTDEYLAFYGTIFGILSHLFSDHKIIECKWVFEIKENPSGMINKYKA